MKLTILYLLLTTLVFQSFSQNKKLPKIKKGQWRAELSLTEKDVLPFELSVQKVKKEYIFNIHNGEETIQLTNFKFSNDSIQIQFPSFNSHLVFHVNNQKQLKGYWINLNKSKNYKIPFIATHGEENRFASTNTGTAEDVNGKWQVAFSENTKDEYPGIGLFKQNGNKLSGTFLTETGDYRYLAGNQYGKELYLSCFDGSHAFLFKANLNNEKLNGTFFSGSHWKTTWEAKRNDSFELPHTDSLTFIVKDEPFHFTLKKLDGTAFSFPNEDFKNKVVIIQIMGTWCPNCMDETRYYKELYSNYHAQGLEIISIGYEIGSTFEEHAEKIQKLKDRMGLDFTFLVGGAANKNLASKQFEMLNEVISFPTSIFIGKDGTVKRVHTGFNGPGTGSYYAEYVEKTNALIESLLKD